MQPAKKKSKSGTKNRGYRRPKIDERVLVFDTETTTDFTQRLLFGVFQLYQANDLMGEGVFLGDALKETEVATVRRYAKGAGLSVYSREDFVHRIFFHHVYGLGTLCVGFNLPFDLSRIAEHAGAGRGKNSRKFRFRLSRYMTYSDVHIESVSGRAAFIQFAPKAKMREWEKPYFKGRFLDLSTLTNALTGIRFSLKRAAFEFKTAHKKTDVELGKITPEAIEYCRNDVTVTWELFEKLRAEYVQYPFATMENERKQAANTVPMTRIYSTASVAKATLALMGFKRAQTAESEEPE